MGILVIGLGALLLGALLILLVSLTAPKPELAAVGEPGEAEPPHGWIARLDAEQLGKLLSMLFAELELEIEESRASGEVVDLLAHSSAPVTGGRVYLRGVVRPSSGVVGEEEVRTALEVARGELVGKALVATGGTFSPEARAAARGAPLELLDGQALLGLVRKHLPPVAAARRV